MKILKLFFVLAIFFVFAGSSFSQTSTDTTKSKKKTSTIKKVYKSYNGCKKSSESCTYFELDYQIVKSGKARSEINQAIQDSLLKSVNIWDNRKASDFKEAASNFISEYEKSLKETTNGANWYLETDARINSNRKNVLSYRVTQSMYTGGAHPNTYLVYYNFDKATGKQISLTDIFGTGFESKLNKVIDTDFRKMKGLSATDNLQDKAGLFENKITYSKNFAIEKKGIRFYYNSYDIAAYVYGPTDLLVSWKDLADILPDASYYSK
ncbi:MAG: DUF3298 and DUF4163 domain-containing protein [Bacteroidetes bacterium]|nr:DUF3298 and DUF4163 domain-containing protein [Bacteroidota bacterium]